MMEPNKIVKLKSNNHKIFEVPFKAVKILEFIMDGLGEDPKDGIMFSLDNVLGPLLEKVVEFLLQYHKDLMGYFAIPFRSNKYKEVREFCALRCFVVGGTNSFGISCHCCIRLLTRNGTTTFLPMDLTVKEAAKYM